MFRDNKGHLQGKLFSASTMISKKAQAKLKSSWAGLFYEHVFAKLMRSPLRYYIARTTVAQMLL
jgi:hypothetical protein